MAEASYVVVFPTAFAAGRIPLLVSNIKKILKVRGQPFKSVRRDGGVILVDAGDPVFASSAIGLLFGIEKISIARRAGSSLAEVSAAIASIGGSLLLKNERFLVRVDGTPRGFLARDAEMAATSQIISARSETGAKPGTDERFDKLLHAHVTRNHAYVSIFSDEGRGGVPTGSQGAPAVCAIYDELSAISCYETIRQGYDVRIIVCYRRDPELLGLAKAANQILPRLVQDRVDVDFFHLKSAPAGTKNHHAYLCLVLEVLLAQPEQRVSLAVPPLIFPPDLTDRMTARARSAGKVPLIPLAGAESEIFADAAELGMGRRPAGLLRTIRARHGTGRGPEKGAVSGALKSLRRVRVTVGPNNVHDMLDSLHPDH